MIEEIPGKVKAYRFIHAFTREALQSEIPANARVRLHARIAKALEEHYGEDADAHANELAEHYSAAESVSGPDRSIHYDLIAGISSNGRGQRNRGSRRG